MSSNIVEIHTVHQINSTEKNQIHYNINTSLNAENKEINNNDTNTNINIPKQKMSTLLKTIIIISVCVIAATAIIVPIAVLTNKNEDNNKDNNTKVSQNIKPYLGDANPYKRNTLQRIEKDDSYLLNFVQSNILENKFGRERLNNFKFCELNHLYYYHYACESVDDSGLGCA